MNPMLNLDVNTLKLQVNQLMRRIKRLESANKTKPKRAAKRKIR
jgi:hypothetical protein